jgi:hypothetical protein
MCMVKVIRAQEVIEVKTEVTEVKEEGHESQGSEVMVSLDIMMSVLLKIMDMMMNVQ